MSALFGGMLWLSVVAISHGLARDGDIATAIAFKDLAEQRSAQLQDEVQNEMCSLPT
jgi:hypothetical protein